MGNSLNSKLNSKLCTLGSDCWTLKFDFFKCSLAQRDQKKKKKKPWTVIFSPVCAQIVFKCLNETFLVMCQTQGLQAFVTVPAPIPAPGQAGHTTSKSTRTTFKAGSLYLAVIGFVALFWWMFFFPSELSSAVL